MHNTKSKMKGCLAFLCCLALTSGFVLNGGDDAQWRAWKAFYKKSYETQSEENARRAIWRDNLKIMLGIQPDTFTNALLKSKIRQLADIFWKFTKITKYNSQGRSHVLAMNQFGDLTQNEYRFIYLGTRRHYFKETRRNGSTYLPLSHVTLPAEVDWRKEGYVTPVKNQGQCGSCWAFSSTGSLEGQHFKKTGRLVSLSEQNLVDCSGSYGNQGCEGGLMDNSFRYIKANGGIDTEASYPYEGVDGRCRFRAEDVGATDSGYVDITQGSENDLQSATATVGPISVAIDASHMSFQFYSRGVYDNPSCSSTQLDHGVLVVGYGTYQGKEYWLVKNSWGRSWGMEGYIMMSRNKNNQCGIATSASYPLV